MSLCVRDSGPIQLLTSVSLDTCLPCITRLVGAHGRNCFLSYRKALSKSQSLRGIIVKSARTETPGQCYRGDSDFKWCWKVLRHSYAGSQQITNWAITLLTRRKVSIFIYSSLCCLAFRNSSQTHIRKSVGKIKQKSRETEHVASLLGSSKPHGLQGTLLAVYHCVHCPSSSHGPKTTWGSPTLCKPWQAAIHRASCDDSSF